jgi:hypothetical protein
MEMHPLADFGIGVLGALLIGAGLLHLFPRLGGAGRAVAARLCRGLGLDLVITYFTAAPWIFLSAARSIEAGRQRWTFQSRPAVTRSSPRGS